MESHMRATVGSTDQYTFGVGVYAHEIIFTNFISSFVWDMYALLPPSTQLIYYDLSITPL